MSETRTHTHEHTHIHTTMKVGKQAPDFRATAYINGDFKDVGLGDYKGKWVCLFFYPLDFTFVCPTEIKSFGEYAEKFHEAGCEILGCSTDSEFSHKNWYERDLKNIKFPVLADTALKISRDYQVLVEDKGIALRGTFLIDPKGMLQYASVNNLDVGRSVDEIYRTLKAFQTGGLCPVGWKPGEETLKV